MTDKELKRLSRQELLEELYSYAQSNADLQLKLENCEEEKRRLSEGFQQELAAEHYKLQMVTEKLKAQEKRNTELNAKLRRRNVELTDAGNIAEATVKMTGIFEEAQKTAELYLANVQKLAEQQERKLQEMEAKSLRDMQKMGDEASKTCIAMRQQTERECREQREKTESDCKRMRGEAFIQAEEYWNNLTVRLEDFYKAHQGMKELFGEGGIRIPSFTDVNKKKNGF